jgi:hypothetical protein
MGMSHTVYAPNLKAIRYDLDLGKHSSWNGDCAKRRPALRDCCIAIGPRKQCLPRVTNGPRGPARRASVDPPIPDEISAARKSAVPCQKETRAPQQNAGVFEHSSARVRRVAGAVIPSALAVLRLIPDEGRRRALRTTSVGCAKQGIRRASRDCLADLNVKAPSRFKIGRLPQFA